jgi:1-acyl-sn-glycerol-3-phosphate acyltransferase
MLYWLLRWIAATALRWYYRDIRVVGTENIPLKGPVIFAVNHPNALVDALVAGTVIRRRIRLTGKATLFERPALALFLRWAGVVPLRRASDEARHGRNGLTPARNAESFRELGDVLSRGGAMLIFPEGKSHSEPRLAPLKTGIARIALEARDVRGVRGLTIVPIGLIFERKEKPRSRVVVQVGEPVSVDELAESGTGAVASRPAIMRSV